MMIRCCLFSAARTMSHWTMKVITRLCPVIVPPCDWVALLEPLKKILGRDCFRAASISFDFEVPMLIPTAKSGREFTLPRQRTLLRISHHAKLHLMSPPFLHVLLLVGGMPRRNQENLPHLSRTRRATTSRRPRRLQPLQRVLQFRHFHGIPAFELDHALPLEQVR
jgi:hypothetical protein